MHIQEVQVKNFRSILDETLPCDSLTALVGRNGAGKSSFLSALELFYNSSAKVTEGDFHAEDVSQDIEIAVTFAGLSPEEKECFSHYLDDGILTVTRVFAQWPNKNTGTYHGTRLQNPDFSPVRNAGNNTDARSKYNEIKKTEGYSSLPSVRSADAARSALADWERQHPEKCSRMRDDGQFFGFTQVGQGYLGKYTKFLRVPAVRDAQEDATEKRGASVTEIMDLVVRSSLKNRKDLADFRQETQTRYRELLEPERLHELTSLQEDLSNTLCSYAPESGVSLQWSALSDISIPMPQVQIKLVEDGYESEVERTGHGLQRAFIVTLLQHLVAARESATEMEEGISSETPFQGAAEPDLPSLVLAIEEPELYQHPSRQRHLASVLLALSEGSIPGVARQTQVVYTTHSPLFVGLDRFSQIRVLRKVHREDGKPKVTRLKRADMSAVADELGKASGVQKSGYTAESLQPRLQAIMTPWVNEGFFADTVVLVEGEGDRAAILGMAKALDLDFDGEGIVVVPCSGKNSLDRPLTIFRQLDIPVYVVWDGDYGKQAKPNNGSLLRLLGKPEEDWPEYVAGDSACFKVNLEKTLESELGKEFFDQALENERELNKMNKDQVLKNAEVIRRILGKADSDGLSCPSLKGIVEKIAALNAKPRR